MYWISNETILLYQQSNYSLLGINPFTNEEWNMPVPLTYSGAAIAVFKVSTHHIVIVDTLGSVYICDEKDDFRAMHLAIDASTNPDHVKVGLTPQLYDKYGIYQKLAITPIR